MSLRNETFSFGTPAAANRSITLLSTPQVRADKAFRRRWRVGQADFQDLIHQCGIVWNPVSHHDSPTGTRHPHHLFGDVKRLGGEHCAKDAYDEIEAAIFEIVEI